MQPSAVRYLACPVMYSHVPGSVCCLHCPFVCSPVLCLFVKRAGGLWQQQLPIARRLLCAAACAAMRTSPGAFVMIFGTVDVSRGLTMGGRFLCLL